MEIVLYSTGCPQCNMLKRLLDSKGVNYIVNNDVRDMMRLGLTSVPYLSIDGELFDCAESFAWINGNMEESGVK